MKPEKTFKAGQVEAAVWCNEREIDGEVRELKSVSFKKHYKDKDGEWKDSSTLMINDLPKAIVVLSTAFEYLTLKPEVAA